MGNNELGQFIPLHYHFNMLQDKMRMTGFKNAIELLVQEGDTVIELGGGTGVLSFFAARKAKKVYTIEYNEDLVNESKRLLAMNKNGDRVEVIHADAAEFTPAEPVQVVICEMLHVAQLREKQLQVIEAFKENYSKKFDGQLPLFIPGATIHAVQLVQQDYDFEGYHAPVTIFQDPYAEHASTVHISNPEVYWQYMYDSPFESNIKWKGTLTAAADGNLNALRFITKSILCASISGSTEWFSNYMVHPLPNPVEVTAGSRVIVEFEYKSGDPLTSLKLMLTLV